MDPYRPYGYQNSFNFSQNFLDFTEEQTNHSEHYSQNDQGYPYSSPSPHPSSYGTGSAFQQWSSQQHVPSLDEIQVIPEPNLNPERAPRKKNSRQKEVPQKTPTQKTSRQGGEKRMKWSIGEDLLLASAWVNTSTNIIIGTNQKSELFWDRVEESYNTKKVEEDDNWVHRSSTSLKARWLNIATDTQKFVSSYMRASRHKASGQNEVDVVRHAHASFHSATGANFLFEHVWREIQDEPKWCAWLGRQDRGGSSKRSKLNEDGFYSSSSNPDTPTSASGPESVTFPPHESSPVRPIGIKAAKRKGKQAAQSSSVPMQAHLEQVDRLTTLQANRDMKKQEAKKENLKEQKKIIDEYVRTQNELVRTQKLQMLTQLLSLSALSPEQEMIKAELMSELFSK